MFFSFQVKTYICRGFQRLPNDSSYFKIKVKNRFALKLFKPLKKIKLNKYTAPAPGSIRSADKLYSVALGNGYKCTFPNEKETLQFLAETNKELNNKMYELNFLYSDVLRLYRASWLYFDKNKIQGLNNIESLCLEKMHSIDRSFNLMVDRAGFENGNFTVFSHFHSIIGSIKSMCELLQIIFKNRGLTAQIYECDGFAMRADYIATSIIIYPNKIKLAIDKLQPMPLKKVV